MIFNGQAHAADLILIPILLLSAYTDVKHGRIYNAITIPACILGLLLGYLAGGLPGFFDSLKGLSIGLTVLLPFCFAGALGGGTLKLFAAVGALKGMAFILYSLGASAVAMVLFALLVTVIKKDALRQSRKIFSVFISLVFPMMKSAVTVESKSHPVSTALAALAGVMAVYCLI